MTCNIFLHAFQNEDVWPQSFMKVRHFPKIRSFNSNWKYLTNIYLVIKYFGVVQFVTMTTVNQHSFKYNDIKNWFPLSDEKRSLIHP